MVTVLKNIMFLSLYKIATMIAVRFIRTTHDCSPHKNAFLNLAMFSNLTLSLLCNRFDPFYHLEIEVEIE